MEIYNEELRDLLAEKVQELIDEMRAMNSVLDEYFYRVEYSHFERQTSVALWPVKIGEQAEKAKEFCVPIQRPLIAPTSTLPPPDRPQYMPQPSDTRWRCPRRARGARERRKQRPQPAHAVHAPVRSRSRDAFSRRTSRRITRQVAASWTGNQTTQPSSLQLEPSAKCSHQLAVR